MSSTIFLIRHGRSGPVPSGWMNAAEFVRWRETYEAAGLDPDDVPPAELKALASGSGIVVASTARRTVESANALASGRPVIPSPLLHELELPPPALGRIRLPTVGWALLFGLRMLVPVAFGRRHVTAEEEQRTRAAAEWLSGLADQHGSVVAVTHASFRSLLGQKLVGAGWRNDGPRGRPRHWSVRSFTRAVHT